MGDGMPLRTIADVFGGDVANRLAMWAIDALCEPPASLTRHATRLPARLVEEGRSILDEAGIDWRELKGTRSSAQTHRRLTSRDGLLS